MQRYLILVLLLFTFACTATAQQTDSVSRKTLRPTYKIRVIDPRDTTALNSFQLSQSDTSTADTTLLLNLDMDLKDQMITLDSIIQLALENSPAMKSEDAMVQGGIQELKLVRRDWMKNIYGNSSYYVGNQNNLAYSADPISNANSLYINGYRTGATIAVPLWDIVSRKPRIALSKAELEAKRAHKDETAFRITQEVIAKYNNLIATYNVLKVLSLSVEASNTNYQFAEKEFRESSITIAELSKVAELNFRSKADFEYGKSAFFTSYTQFEYFIGVKMPELIKKN